MEAYLQSLSKEVTHNQIIGDNQQGIQFLLNHGESIIINSETISYFSSKLDENEITKKQAIEELTEEADKIKNKEINNYSYLGLGTPSKLTKKEFVKFSNFSKELQYIGVSSNGRIMTLNPLLYDHLFINIHNIIAYTQGISLFLFQSMMTKMKFDFLKIPNAEFFNFYLMGLNNQVNNGVTDYQRLYLQSESKLIYE